MSKKHRPPLERYLNENVQITLPMEVLVGLLGAAMGHLTEGGCEDDEVEGLCVMGALAAIEKELPGFHAQALAKYAPVAGLEPTTGGPN